MSSKSIGWVVASVALIALFAAVTFRVVEAQPTAPATPAAPASAAAGAKYTVVDTEATNLLVVDNSNNTLYFYTVDEGKEPGADLNLRGSIDLNEVGKAVIKPKKTAKEGGK